MKNYSYVISSEDSFNQIEHSTILSLYQPIIGASASAIYFTLINEGRNSKVIFSDMELEIDRLIKISGLDEQNFELELKKLESVQLLKRFFNKTKKAIKFEIFKPMQAKVFFMNEVFKNLLLKKVGEDTFESLEFTCLKKCNYVDEEFEEMTSTSLFDLYQDDIRKIKEQILTDPVTSDLAKRSLFGIHLNLEKIAGIIFKEENLELDLESEMFLPYLKFVASSRRIRSKEMANMIIKFFDFETSTFADEEFINYALIKRSFKFDETTLSKITQYKSFEPAEFYKILTNKEIDQMGRVLIYKLSSECGFKNDCINALMEYSYEKNRMIINNYIFKIVETLREKRIEKVEEIYNFFKKIKTPKTKKISDGSSKEDNYFFEMERLQTSDKNLETTEILKLFE